MSDSDGGWNIVQEGDAGIPADEVFEEVAESESMDSQREEPEEVSDDDEPVPISDSLKRLFGPTMLGDYTQTFEQRESKSLFSKVSKKVDQKTVSGNLVDQHMANAQKVFESNCIIKGANDK